MDNYNDEKLFCEKVKSKAKIQVVAKDYVRNLEKRNGKWDYVGLSIFNEERTPSFKIYSKKQIFHCFSSSKSGDVLDLVQVVDKLSTRYEAAKKINNKYDLNIEEDKKDTKKKSYGKYSVDEKKLIHDLEYINEFTSYQIIATDSKALEYLKKRDIKKDTAVFFNIGFLQFTNELNRFLKTKKYLISEEVLFNFKKMENRLLIPICDIDGNIIDYSGRSINQNDEEKYCKLASHEKYNLLNINKKLYNLDKAISYVKALNQVILVEGYFDVFRLYQCGIKNVIAIQTAHLSEQQIKQIIKLNVNIVIFLDSDKAGIEGANQIAECFFRNQNFDKRISIVNWNRIIHDEKDDPDSFGRKNGEAIETIINDAENFEEAFIIKQLDRLENDDTYTLREFMKDTNFKIYYYEEYLKTSKNIINEKRIDLRNEISILYEDNIKLQSMYLMNKFNLEDIYARKVLTDSLNFIKEAREMHKTEFYLIEKLNEIYESELIEMEGGVFENNLYSKSYHFGINIIHVKDSDHKDTDIIKCTFDYLHKKIYLKKRIRKLIDSEKNNKNDFFNSESIIYFGSNMKNELDEFCISLKEERVGADSNEKYTTRG